MERVLNKWGLKLIFAISLLFITTSVNAASLKVGEKEFEDFLQKEQTKQYRKCTSKDINILKDIKKKLNVESAIIKTDTDVYINILEDEINFKEGDIDVLFSLLENNTLDFITIVPRLNKETLLQINDILKGEHRKQQVQMVLGISLENK